MHRFRSITVKSLTISETSTLLGESIAVTKQLLIENAIVRATNCANNARRGIDYASVMRYKAMLDSHPTYYKSRREPTIDDDTSG